MSTPRCPHLSAFPDDVLDCDPPAEGGGRRWGLAYVRSRHEAHYAAHLRRVAVPYYLPYHLQRAESGNRMRRWWTPLFAGYVFVYGDHAERLRARSEDALVAMIAVENQARLHDELRQVNALVGTGAPLLDHPFLDAGSTVDVVDGPFAGFRGTVVRTHGDLRLVVSITLLRRSVAVELGREAVLPARAAV